MLKWFYWTEQGFNILTSIKCQKIRENAHNKFPAPMRRLLDVSFSYACIYAVR